MYCKNCGAEVNKEQAVCVQCGTKVGEGNSYCVNCGEAISPDSEVCLKCGYAIKKQGGDFGKYDKMTMALICFFLGSIGIHNFMLGESKKGIFKIVMTCCFGIGAILALIDFIRILTDNYEVNPDKIF